jgi:outer membrane protein TolC
MRYKLILIIFMISCAIMNAQDSLLMLIEKNNSTLRAVRENTGAEKIGNQTGIFLKNPEAEFNYLWGHPAYEGNRTDIKIMQSFDFPTAYKYRRLLAEMKNEQADLAYGLHRQSILFEVRMLIIEYSYYNTLLGEISKRVENAIKLDRAYSRKYENGEANIIELNRTKLNLAGLQNKLENISIHRQSIFAELERLNGGIEFDPDLISHGSHTVEEDFEKWYSIHEKNNPVLKYLRQHVLSSEAEEKLTGAMNLPKFNTGYMSERVSGQVFQGFTLGVSIPLWENKNMSKYAKARTLAAQIREEDARITIYHKLRMLHSRAVSLQKNVSEYRISLSDLDNTRLLEIALESGEISLVEYLFELVLNYESKDRLIELEKNLGIAIAELYQYDL